MFQACAISHGILDGMNEIEAVIEMDIYVDDLERAEAFYRDGLGLAIIGKEPAPAHLLPG